MTRIGIIGVGFMGYTHFEGIRDLTGASVTAIATRDPKKRSGDWTGIQGNFGPPGGQVDVSEMKCYEDYKELLADPEIDLVDVCLPTDKHFNVVMESLAAGKPTLVEKPISVSLEEARQMVTAANEANVPLMVAHVLPFFPEFQFAAQAIASGEFGKLRAGHFKRVICRPDWSSDMSDFRKLGGWGIDLHIHDNHFIAHACGKPQSVVSSGLLQDDMVNHVHTTYFYDDDDGPTISAVSGGIAASGLAFGHGFDLYFDDATIVFDAGTYAGEWVVNRPLSVVRNDGTVKAVDLTGSDKWCAAFTQELKTAVDHLNGAAAGPLSAQLALDALKICYAEAESMRSGKRVSV